MQRTILACYYTSVNCETLLVAGYHDVSSSENEFRSFSMNCTNLAGSVVPSHRKEYVSPPARYSIALCVSNQPFQPLSRG